MKDFDWDDFDRIEPTTLKVTNILDSSGLKMPDVIYVLLTILETIHRTGGKDVPVNVFWHMIFDEGSRISKFTASQKNQKVQ